MGEATAAVGQGLHGDAPAQLAHQLAAQRGAGLGFVAGLQLPGEIVQRVGQRVAVQALADRSRRLTHPSAGTPA